MDIVCYCLSTQIKFLYLGTLNQHKYSHSKYSIYFNRAQKNTFCFSITPYSKSLNLGSPSIYLIVLFQFKQEMPGLGLISLRMVGSIVRLSALLRAAMWLDKGLIQLLYYWKHTLDSRWKNSIGKWNANRRMTVQRITPEVFWVIGRLQFSLRTLNMFEEP